MMCIAFRVISLVAWGKVIVSNGAASERSFTIYHNIGNGYEERGTKLQLSVENNQVSASIIKDDEKSISVSSFYDLMAKKDMYSLRVIDDLHNRNEIITSVSSCAVIRSNFREQLTLEISPTADLISMTYKPIISPLAPRGCSTFDGSDKSVNFTTHVSFETASAAMTIPLILPSDKNARPTVGVQFFPSNTNPNMQNERNDGRESLFRKYWYIVLPVVLMSLFGGGPEEAPVPREQGGGSGAPAVANAQPVRSTVTSANASAAGVKARRGKRS